MTPPSQRRLLAAGAVAALSVLGTPGVGQVTCVKCHGDAALIRGIVADTARARRLHIDPTALAASIHGRRGLACTSCHTDVEGYPHRAVAPVDCGTCHRAAFDQWSRSVHGRPHPMTGTSPASCVECHGSHDILLPTDPQASVYRLVQFETCAGCHSDAERMAPFGQEDVETVGTYLNSVHGRGLLQKGLTVVPVCTDCHGEAGTGAHEIDEVSNPSSAMSRGKVVGTCGRCHVGIMNQYNGGIHGQEFHKGNPDTPTCIGCHTDHAVQPITSPASSVYPTHIAQTCTACHDRLDLNEKYGIPSERRRTFLGSFHGIALRSGQLTVANCGSCHGSHEILPSSDFRSSIHPANLTTTCGACHPGIGSHVAEGKIHVASIREDVNLLAYGVQWFYYVLIGGLMAYAVLMIALDQYRHHVIDRRRGARPRA